MINLSPAPFTALHSPIPCYTGSFTGIPQHAVTPVRSPPPESVLEFPKPLPGKFRLSLQAPGKPFLIPYKVLILPSRCFYNTWNLYSLMTNRVFTRSLRYCELPKSRALLPAVPGTTPRFSHLEPLRALRWFSSSPWAGEWYLTRVKH